jgi:hypothetical protein
MVVPVSPIELAVECPSLPYATRELASDRAFLVPAAGVAQRQLTLELAPADQPFERDAPVGDRVEHRAARLGRV